MSLHSRGKLPGSAARSGLCRRGPTRIPLRVHQDIVLTNQMFVDPAEEVILLPAATRYETQGGVTQRSPSGE